MTLGERLSVALEHLSETYPNAVDFAEAAGISKQYLNGLLSGAKQNPSAKTEQGLAKAMGITRSQLVDPDDDAFVRAVREGSSVHGSVDTTEHSAFSSDPDRGRAGLVRSFPVDSGVRSDGTVFGRITYDVIKDPTGKGGMVLKLGHSRRGKKKSVESREVSGVRQGDAVVFVDERLEIYAANGRIDDVLKPGTALIVSPEGDPEPGGLVLVAKNIDWSQPVEAGSDEGLAGVWLMRYVEVEVDGEPQRFGWPISGRKAEEVRIDGPYSLVGRVVGRWLDTRGQRRAP